jgi:hypothetical protein
MDRTAQGSSGVTEFNQLEAQIPRYVPEYLDPEHVNSIDLVLLSLSFLVWSARLVFCPGLSPPEPSRPAQPGHSQE